ncbi:MAG: YibE/F family protein [Actinobacteria bacterium]|nr:YibE/F family protein [Actinomycetota bacterium]
MKPLANLKKTIPYLLIFFIAISFLMLGGCSGQGKKTFEQWEKIEAQRIAAVEKDEQYKGKVLEIISDTEEELEGGFITRTQVLKVKITSGPFKNEIIEVLNTSDARSAYNITIKKGQGIFVKLEFDGKGDISGAYVTELVRDNYIIIIVFLFFAILVLIGRLKGLRAAITLAATVAAVFFILIPLILRGFSPVLISVVIGIAITVMTLLVIGGTNRKSLAAIAGTSLGILIAGAFALIFGSVASLTGFSSDEAIMLLYIPQNIDFNFRGLLFAGIILASLGAVMDIGMSISSSMFEIAKADPAIKRKDLVSAGMNVGRDIIGTMSNTLILVYVGSSLPLILLFVAYKIPFIEIINKDMVASEIIRALSGSIGLILAIPLTVFISASLYSIDYMRSARHTKR